MHVACAGAAVSAADMPAVVGTASGLILADVKVLAA